MSGASSTQRSRRGYRRLLSQQFSFNWSEKSSDEKKATASKTKRLSNSKDTKISHPVMKILEAQSKKAVSKPEFLRYLEYVREAGRGMRIRRVPQFILGKNV
uniref:Uncharacterized protein n=1 Tax=Ananas comosus var. bracteatus TaxID=296719 RepID=A0A6V7NZU6_ANACO|nr:unnamed protein product [Ananas comosus var. bracteatus]